ncbi:MAG TPA: D-TA family PLP-dependent enzyme [Candidatus Acidoferrales bacterium]|nr:D-TA family PLP-dependent enzyme [Candidatus Acidoferrales bacterium]
MSERGTVSTLSPGTYRIQDAAQILTPALLIYPELVESNIRATLRLLDGEANRWRPHVKTAKLEFVMRTLVAHGVTRFKCATTLELLTACHAGASDVLVAYPLQGANLRRVREIAREFSAVRISALVDRAETVEAWEGSTIGLFVDVNPGMNRTGIEQNRSAEVIRVARAVLAAKLEFRGVHYYDGHLSKYDLPERTTAAHRGYDQLLALVTALEAAGLGVPEVITAGTPALPCSLSYAGFRGARFVHRVSPGTVVFGDATSCEQLPAAYGYQPAVLVLARVVSHPAPNILTCDAGHKSVSADCGVPNCAVLGRPDLLPRAPSEEHLPMEVPSGAAKPAVGEFLYLIPRHVCPTVNNFDDALLVRGGVIERLERVTARGHESPLSAGVSVSA